MHILRLQILQNLLQRLRKREGFRSALRISGQHGNNSGVEVDEHHLVFLHRLLEIVIVQQQNAILSGNFSHRETEKAQSNKESFHSNCIR